MIRTIAFTGVPGVDTAVICIAHKPVGKFSKNVFDNPELKTKITAVEKL